LEKSAPLKPSSAQSRSRCQAPSRSGIALADEDRKQYPQDIDPDEAFAPSNEFGSIKSKSIQSRF